jgi:hypothetical protein
VTNAPSNAVIAAATPPATVAALIARLHPVPCGYELIRVGTANDGGYLIPDDMLARENRGFRLTHASGSRSFVSICVSRVSLSSTCCDTVPGCPSRWSGSP